MADSKDKIKKQIEFYFGDSNLPKDKFLLGEIAKNPEGLVNLDVFLTFNRIKSLTSTVEDLKDALKDSTLLVLSGDGTQIKRATPLPENDTSSLRTIYAKRFPDNTTMEDVEKLFAPHGKVLCVRLRRTKDKIFKRSVFVEFSTEEEAQDVLKKKLTYDGADLELLSLGDYQKAKKQELEEKKNTQKGKRKKPEGEEGKEEEEGKDGAKEKETRPFDYNPGLVLRFEEIGPMALAPLKELFNQHGKVKFVTYKDQDSSGFVRFESADEAQKVFKELNESKKELGGKVPKLTVLSGDEEKDYWKQVQKELNARHQDKRKRPKWKGHGRKRR